MRSISLLRIIHFTIRRTPLFTAYLTALIQSNPKNFSGLHRAWVETEEHDALIVSAWNRAIRILGEQPSRAIITLGLPTSLFDTARAPLLARAHALLRQQVPASTVIDVRVRSQGEGPLMLLSFKDDGTPNPDHDLDRETWGVVEVGHFTTDFSLATRGQVQQEVAEHPCKGVHQVYHKVSAELGRIDPRFSRSLESTEKAVLTGVAIVGGKETDVSAVVSEAKRQLGQKVANDAMSLFGETLDTLSGVVVAGGGADIVRPALAAHFEKVVCPDNPRFAVAEGFARMGLAILG